MINLRFLSISATICFAIFLGACGGHGAYNSPSSGNTAPTAPTNIAGNAGDGAASLGWEAPTTGSTPITYNIAISPSTSAIITISGTHALIRGLTNDTSYTFSVTAKNDAGESTATTLLLKPTAAPTTIAGLNPIPSGITSELSNYPNDSSGVFDPSLLNVSGRLWMAYSSVNYYQQSSNTVKDVSTSLAYSDDSGATFTYLKTIGTATGNITVTPGAAFNPCGNVTCPGRWVYEVPFLVDDATDPDLSKRFKLFALKYFLYPPTPPTTFYGLGAIVMWTAPSPESSWSNESVVLSWDSTPPELTRTNNIKNIDAALTECLVLTEGSATTYQGVLDFVFACPNNSTTQKIVLLRSSDHANTFKYISTPLAAADAASFNTAYAYFSAPALIPTESSAPILIVTPVINRTVSINGTNATDNFYSGCVAFPFADEETGKLFRSSTAPLSILQIGYQLNHLNGACTWERGASSSGILLNDGNAITGTSQFSILKTTKNF